MTSQLRIGAHIEPRDPFWVQVREAVHQRAQHIGIALVWLDADPTLLDAHTAEAVVDVGRQQLDALIAIYVAEPLVMDLLSTGMAVVHLSETELDAPQMIAPVGLYDSALEAAAFLAARLDSAGNILVVGGLCDAGEGGRSRLSAIANITQQHPALTITHIPCVWSPQQARQQLVAALQSLPTPVDAILGLSDSLAMLARDVAIEQGIAHATTLVVGINGDPAALAAVAAGTMTATVETPAADFGAQAVDYACLLARGEPLPEPFGYRPQLVTAHNVAEVAVRKLIALAELPSRLVGVNREQEQQRMATLEIGLEINRRVGGLMNRQQLSHLMADLIRTNFRYHSVQLLLWEPHTRALLRDTAELSDVPQQIIPEGALAAALRDNRIVFIPDVHQHDSEDCVPSIRSRVVVPIRLGQTILGLLDMQSDRPMQHSRQDLAGLQSLADQLGVAMQNAELYEAALHARRVAERADQLKTHLLANVSHELRTPLNVILGYSQSLLMAPTDSNPQLPPEVLQDIRHIYQSGEHLIQLINDLLDLSRADIGELDLFPERIEPVAFLREVFQSMARSAPFQPDLIWSLDVPERLPPITADPTRLRQILFNLLQNAQRYTRSGQIILGAEELPESLHVWVADTGVGISVEMQQLIFEPFTRGEHGEHRVEGIGLGLSIARRLVALHGGRLVVESVPYRGSTFHVHLPWPAAQFGERIETSGQQVLLLIGASKQGVNQQGLEMLQLPTYHLAAEDNVDVLLTTMQPTAMVLDLESMGSAEWALVQRVRGHAVLGQLPLLFSSDQSSDDAPAAGATGIVLKPLRDQTLADAIRLLQPETSSAPILIVDDDPAARSLYCRLVSDAFPDRPLQTASDGAAALTLIGQQLPGLVILDLSMPEIDGFEVLAQLRAAPRTCQLPVLVLSGAVLSDADLRQLNHMRVTFQSKDILAEDELTLSITQMLHGLDRPAQQTGVLVRRALAFMQHNYNHPLARHDIADAIGVHKDYLSRIFQQELGISPWEFLQRYRIKQAKLLLRSTARPITDIAGQVGFEDSAYFSRVFRSETGCSPRAYRDQFDRS